MRVAGAPKGFIMHDISLDTIQVTYKSTRNAYTASQYLDEIRQHSLIACDFEVAVKFTSAERQAMQDELDTNPSKMRRIQLEAALAATALDHPSYCTLTHCSIAISDHEAYVFILDNKSITNLILQFLVTTPIKQIWHNASFDFRYIYYFTGKFPLDYEDSQIFAKTLVNHVDTYKANTGLKELAGSAYGAWALAPDSFTLDHMYDSNMWFYAATDACATYWVYNGLLTYCKDTI